MSSSGKIVNLVNPDYPQDAATKIYVDNGVANATAVGNNAQSAANNAQSTANTAQTTANTAVTNAATAQSTANTAQTTANTAVTNAATAQSAANTAQTTANTAVTDAATAQTTANTAVTDAATAQTTATLVSAAITYTTATASARYLAPAPGGDAGILTGTPPQWRLYVSQWGQVGIGTTNPLYKLHVEGGTSYSSGRTLVSEIWWPSLGIFNNRSFGGFDERFFTISIYASNDIRVGGGVFNASDKRIKKNIRDIDGNTALSQIRKIKPKIYNYIDELTKQGEVYGFIAQDVDDIILHSSIKTKEYIPNFYCKGDIFVIDQANHIYEISTENELIFEKMLDNKENEVIHYNIRIYDDKNNKYICSVINIIDPKKIIVKCEKEYILSTIEEYKNKVFIFGQEVNDFYNLDKDAIFTVATAALQEVDRQQQADKAWIAELENHVSILEAKVSEQQSLINDILERLNNAKI